MAFDHRYKKKSNALETSKTSSKSGYHFFKANSGAFTNDSQTNPLESSVTTFVSPSKLSPTS